MATALILFELPLSGGAGTVGYTLYNADGTEAAARTTAGITETPANSGMYSANPTLPGGFSEGFFVADDGSGNYTRGIAAGVGAGGGLTSQDVRDAMKLAPTAGAPAADSVDDKLDGLSIDTGISFSVAVDNEKIVPARVAKLSSRLDDVTVAEPSLSLRPGEILPVWIDCSPQANGWLKSIASAVSSNASAFTIVEDAGVPRVGVNRDHVVIWLEAVGADGDSSDITADVSPGVGQTMKVKLTMEINDD